MSKIDPEGLKELIKTNEGILNVVSVFSNFFESIVWRN